ncbi:MAG: hypothetical protein WA324_24065 [Bryobacteraceae bacterium]
MTQFEQVGAYTFRGDTRAPEDIERLDGFHPPSLRTDSFYVAKIAHEFVRYMERMGLSLDAAGKAQLEKEVEGYMQNQPATDRKMFTEYHMWRETLNRSSMHLQGMTDDPFLKAYISTTRDINVACYGAAGSLASDAVGNQSSGGDQGCVYVLRVDSGFLLKEGIGGISKNEGEVAHLGSIQWKNVYGFKRRAYGGSIDTNIYIRRELFDRDYAAFKQVLGSLSSI